jgi:isopenicillin N synthase-like dioxygenase
MIAAACSCNEQRSYIPVIDLAECSETLLAQKLVDAFQTIGFATLIRHGVDLIIPDAFRASRSFFQLDMGTKLQYQYQSHASNRGYIPMGSEAHDETKPDRKETFDIGKEGEVGFETPWPRELENFQSTLLEYFRTMNVLHLKLLKLLAIGLELTDTNYFVDRCNEQHCNLRLLHYPELNRPTSGNCDYDGESEVVQRGATHTDFGTITLLAQDMVGGLRVQKLDGTWIHVTPVAGSIVVNVGDMLQYVQN